MSKTTDIFYRHNELDMIVTSPMFTSCTPQSGFADQYVNGDILKRLNGVQTRIRGTKIHGQSGGGKSRKSETTETTEYSDTMASKYFPDKTSEFSTSVYSETPYLSESSHYNTEDLCNLLKDDITTTSDIAVKKAPIRGKGKRV